VPGGAHHEQVDSQLFGELVQATAHRSGAPDDELRFNCRQLALSLEQPL
jgi:hypothetical protein